MRKRLVPHSLLVALLLLACAKDGGSAQAAPAAPPNAASPKPAAAPAPQGMSLEEAARLLPGLPLEDVPGHLRRQLVGLAEDEFVFDGSPFTLAGCLRDGRPCRENAIRGLALLARFLNAGASQPDALKAYNLYYRSFEKKNRTQFQLAESACKGPADAPITLVEFSDFECPHCAAAQPTLRKVLQRGDVRLCFMHFPLPGHDHAMSAAQATVFAQRHGKFWELHDLVFENQQRLSSDLIKKLVAQVGLDPKGLVDAVSKDELAPVVERQKKQGETVGIQGTPAVFLNGRALVMGLSPEMLEFTIADELVWLSRDGSWTAP